MQYCIGFLSDGKEIAIKSAVYDFYNNQKHIFWLDRNKWNLLESCSYSYPTFKNLSKSKLFGKCFSNLTWK